MNSTDIYIKTILKYHLIMTFDIDRLAPEEKLLLFLLRDDDNNCINLLSRNEVDFTFFFSLLETHYLSGVFCLALIDKYREHLASSQIAYCKMRIIQLMKNNRVKKKLLAQASKILHEEGIPVLVLKGPVLDLSDRKIRQYNDLDVLISQDDLLRAVSILESQGYVYRGSDILSEREKSDIPGQMTWNNQYQFRFPGLMQEIEVHTNLFERKRVRFENLTALLDNIELFTEKQIWDKGLNAYLPCPEASLILLCLQTALKRSPANNTFILRQAYDIKQLISEGIDWDYFLKLCQKWQISYYTYFSLMLQNDITGFQNKFLLDNLKDLMSIEEKKLAQIHLNCFINLTRNSLLHMLLFRLYMPFALCHSFRRSLMWHIRVCFPLRAVQAKKYKISKDSFFIWGTYLLNPFRAIWLIIKQ